MPIKLIDRITVYPCDCFFWRNIKHREYIIELVMPDCRRTTQTFPDTAHGEAGKAWKRLIMLAYKAHMPKVIIRTIRTMRAITSGRYRTAMFDKLNLAKKNEISPTEQGYTDAMHLHDFLVRTRCTERKNNA